MTTMTRFASVLAATLVLASMTSAAHPVNPPVAAPAIEPVATLAAAIPSTHERATERSADMSNELSLRDHIARGFVRQKGCLRWWSCGPFHRERSRHA